MRTNARYQPPAIDGYVWWSNLLRDDEGRLIPLNDIGRQWCVIRAAERLRVPEDSVRVERFTPDDGYDCEQWTAYIKAEHAVAVREFGRELRDTLRTLMMIDELEADAD